MPEGLKSRSSCSCPPVTRTLPPLGVLPPPNFSVSTQPVLQLREPSLFVYEIEPNWSATVSVTLMFAVFPATPLVWSQARKVRPFVTVPFQSALGTKRTYVVASAASRRAEVLLGEPKLFQELPPLVEYCQTPFVLSTRVTAMPESEDGSLSVAFPEINEETSVPVLGDWSSLMVVRLLAPDKTGALLS